MGYLKIAFYGLLAFIERHPIFCLIVLLLAIFAPFVFKWLGWVILSIIALALIGLLIMSLRFRKMKRQMEDQMRQASGGGFAGGNPFGNMGGNPFGNTNTAGGTPFGNMGGGTNGMTLEDFVKRMQAEADARLQQNGTQQTKRETKKNDVDSTDYVDFEEVK